MRQGIAELTCSVVVCTRDRPAALEECLAAISAGTRSAFELLVVDSAPGREGAEEVAARWGARYIRETRPGVSRARNRAARESKSDILVYVDGDTVPEPGWLEPLLAEFADREVAVAAGRVLPPESDMDMLPTYAWLGILDHGQNRRVFDRAAARWFELSNFESVLLGANMAVRRSVFEGWRGFDERLGAGTRIHGGEEPKAFFDLVKRGYRLVYVPGSVVRHAFPHSEKMLRHRAIRAIEASSAYLTLMFFEEPAYRRQTRDYILGKLKLVAPLFTRETPCNRPLLPGYRVMAARLQGVVLYFIARLLGPRPG
jgi:glycosyltransferase involved in cell wall biosynthesis